MEMFFVHFRSADRTIEQEIWAADATVAEEKARRLVDFEYPNYHWDEVVVNDTAKEKFLRERGLG